MCSCEVFNMVSWFWASSMLLSMPIRNTAFDSENSGNFGDCMKGRVRLMTAITPAYAHAYQATCLAQHFPGVPKHTFRQPKPKSRCPYLPNNRSITRERGNDYRGWVIYSHGCTRVVDCETLAGWGYDFPITSWTN